MDGKYAKSGGLAVGDAGDGIVPAYELEGVADEEHLFGVALSAGSVVEVFDLLQPAQVSCFPFAAFAFQGAAGAAAGDIDIVGEIGDLCFQPDFEFVVVNSQSMVAAIFREQFADTAHALVGLAFIEIEDRYRNFLQLLPDQVAKIRHVDGSGIQDWRRWRRLGIPFDDLVEIVFEAVADGDDLFADIDLVAGDGVDMGERDDIGAVDADELFGRQFVGKGFEVVEGEDGFGPAFHIDLGIVFHPFAEKDILEFDLYDLVFRFDEDEAVIAGDGYRWWWRGSPGSCSSSRGSVRRRGAG